MSGPQKYANVEVFMNSRRNGVSQVGDKRKKGPEQYPIENKKSKNEPRGSRSQRGPKGHFQLYTPLTTSFD